MTDSVPAHVDASALSRPPLGHEQKDVSARGIVLTATGLALTITVSFLVAGWLFDYLNTLDRSTKPTAFPLAAQEQGRLPVPPRLEGLQGLEGTKAMVTPGEQQASKQRQLESYGWVDRQTGIVHIPIDRAMKIIVEQNQQPVPVGVEKEEKR